MRAPLEATSASPVSPVAPTAAAALLFALLSSRKYSLRARAAEAASVPPKPLGKHVIVPTINYVHRKSKQYLYTVLIINSNNCFLL